ncbi:Zinc finger CCCH domain-containing protein 3 [Bienertia sinuspersici]
MTVGKYYCDYCDKEFKDTAAARKRHLQGILHHRNRKLWYDSLSLPQEPNQVSLSTQTLGKGLCNRFLKTGFCPYGDSCRYHHPKHNLQGPIAQGTSSFADNSQLQVERNQGYVASQNFGMSLGNLPPSLRPPPEGGYPPLPFVDWG